MHQGDLSSNSPSDRKAASSGCLSVFLFPPFSAVVFGALLFFGLVHFPEKASEIVPSTQAHGSIATFFTPQVKHWESQILRWSAEHNLDPNLVATVMQIESCGDPDAVSGAGAQGLFQVMPYHFASGEDHFNAETNALRGLNYLDKSQEHFSNDLTLTFAGYNGGINGASLPTSEWQQETRYYVYWGTNIYADATSGKESSLVLDEWLAAGGASLCAQAEEFLAAQ